MAIDRFADRPPRTDIFVDFAGSTGSRAWPVPRGPKSAEDGNVDRRHPYDIFVDPTPIRQMSCSPVRMR
jgi:hypothetical protein